MSDATDALSRHLDGMAGPILFIGSGLSRRYLGLPNWEGLLRHFASKTDLVYEYYRSAASSDYPKIASMIAKTFFDKWWKLDEYEMQRQKWKSLAVDESSPLKIAVSEYLNELEASAKVSSELKAEKELLKKVTIDGIITTNYDGLVRELFPSHKLYIGQDDLLISNVQEIGESYLIHGSSEQPQSIVLTAEDYQSFRERNSYLAAKLTTLFVEHPIIFLGYSLSDTNIQDILTSLIRGLSKRGIEALTGKLVFVEWSATEPSSYSNTILSFNGTNIPAIRVVLSNFDELFRALSNRMRPLPAKTLRNLKEQIFQLVKSGDPSSRLYAVSDIDEDSEKVEVVFGIGAKMTAVGLTGLTRFDIIDDVLGDPDRGLPPIEILNRVIARTSVSTYIPTFKYLQAAAYDQATTKISDGSSLTSKIVDRVNKIKSKIATPSDAAITLFKDIADRNGWEWIFNNAFKIPNYTSDYEGIRTFLLTNKDKRTTDWWSTQYAKLAVVYDWMKYGRDT